MDTIKKMSTKLEATEMWFLRRMLKIPWTDKRTNEDILTYINTERKLMTTIKKSQWTFFGHIMRREGLQNLAVTGKIEGKRARGRQRKKYTDRLREGTEISNNIELIRSTKERRAWKSMVADAERQST